MTETKNLVNLDSFFDVKKEDSPKEEHNFDLDDLENYSFSHEYDDIIEQSKLLQKPEHIEIFKIIHQNNCDYTSNDNGVFVALNKLDEETLKKVRQFMNFCVANKERLDQDTHKREAIKEIMNCQNEKSNGFNKSFLLNMDNES